MNEVNISDQRWAVAPNVDPIFACKGVGVLAVVGPSGSGKTTLAKSLMKRSSIFQTVPMHTTRPMRADDDDQNYRYIDHAALNVELQAGRVLFARLTPFPQYAWLTQSVDEIFRRGEIPIFIFRSHGSRVLLRMFKCGAIVGIEGSPSRIANQSRDQVHRHTLESSAAMLEQNSTILNLARQQGWYAKRVWNEFAGQAALDALTLELSSDICNFFGLPEPHLAR